MFGIFSRKFHSQTNFDYPIGSLPTSSQYWPKQWKEIYHKEYPRMPRIPLSSRLLPLGSLGDALLQRTSQREFNTAQSISFDELSTLLYYTAGVKPQHTDWNLVRRFYPSGGARYPMEVYLLIQRVDTLSPGIYHYNVKDNVLEHLVTDQDTVEQLKLGLYYPWSKDAAAILFFTAVWDRNFMKYQDRGYRIVLMEAGHMAQNLALTATALHIKHCNAVAFHNEHVEQMLDIGSEDENTLYMTVLGK